MRPIYFLIYLWFIPEICFRLELGFSTFLMNSSWNYIVNWNICLGIANWVNNSLCSSRLFIFETRFVIYSVSNNHCSVLRGSVFLGWDNLPERTRACSNSRIAANRWIPRRSYKIHAASRGEISSDEGSISYRKRRWRWSRGRCFPPPLTSGGPVAATVSAPG